MLVPLAAAVAPACGGKAGTLGRLLRAGFAVPDGVVVPFGADPPDADLAAAVARLGGTVAVRSSASGEDTAAGSAAGQHDSFLGVGAGGVAAAVRACRASLWSRRAAAYRGDGPAGRMAVLVQRQVAADVAGVMFVLPGETVIEAAPGTGVVTGRVNPRRRRVPAGAGPDDPLVRTGRAVAALLGGPQDVEWALAGDDLWLLQARPVTAGLPEQPVPAGPPGRTFAGGLPEAGGISGVPGSSGRATGPVRVVRGPADFGRVRRGDILVCRFTDPAWTPLLRVVAGVVTEVGGLLSHAAIVAREYGVPAVLGVDRAMSRLTEGEPVTVDGSRGLVRGAGATPHAPGSEDGR